MIPALTRRNHFGMSAVYEQKDSYVKKKSKDVEYFFDIQARAAFKEHNCFDVRLSFNCQLDSL